jgi:hypothetical protein
MKTFTYCFLKSCKFLATSIPCSIDQQFGSRWRYFSPYQRNAELNQVPGIRVHEVGDCDDGHCQTIPLLLLVATFLPPMNGKLN